MSSSQVMPSLKPRNNMVQIIRAIAIIAVVLIHTTPKTSMFQIYLRPFFNFSVSTFLFLSGYLTKIENDNWGKFYKKRLVRVLIPYVIWTILYSIPLLHGKGLNMVPYYLLTAKATTPLYYIFVYVQFVLLTPLIGMLAKSRYQYIGWLIAPFSVVIFKYWWLLTGEELNSWVRILWDDSCLGWFTFYYMGLILGNKLVIKDYSLKVLLVLYLLAIVLQMGESYVWLSLGGKGCGTQLKLSALLSSSMFLLMVYTILKQEKVIFNNKLLSLLGDYSFGIYLCHLLVKKVITDTPNYSSIPYPITSLIIILLSFSFCYVTDKICGKRISRLLGIC